MRILQVVYFFPSVPNVADGVVQSAHETSLELARRGHEVTVYASNALDLKSRKRINPARSTMQVDGVSVHYFPFILKQGTIAVTPSMISILKRTIGKFDVVHVHSCISFQGFLASIFAKRHGVPCVVQAHGSVPRNQQRFLKSVYDRLFSFRMLKNASKVIALTPAETQQYVNIGIPKEKIETIPNGINLSNYRDLPTRGTFRKKFAISNNQKIVLYLGRIHKVKGLDILLEAFARVVAKLQDVKLVIAGPDDGYLEELERLIKALGIENHVHVVGPVYGIDKLTAYVDADVYVLPSRYETFPMSVLEAVACGTPVILSENCGVAEYFKDRVGLVVKPDSSHLKEALLEILQNHERRMFFRENCRDVIEDFSISQTVSMLEKIYDKLSYSNACGKLAS